MAEIFGIVASSITVAEVAAKAGGVIPKLKGLWDEIQNVPETIKDLMKRIDILDPLLWEMETEINEGRAAINPILFNDNALRRSTEYCREAVKDLTSLVDDLRVQIDTERKSRRRLGKLKVVLKARTIADYEKRLEKAVSIFSLAQQSYLTAMMKLAPHILVQTLKEAQDQSSQRLIDSPGHSQGPLHTTTRPSTENIQDETCDKEAHPNTQPSNAFVVAPRKRQPRLPWHRHARLGAIATSKVEACDSTTSFTETAYNLRIELPRWLAGRAWDIQFQKAISGWTTHLRTWRIVDRESSLAFDAVFRRDATTLRCLFDEGRASPFERDEDGATLLHWAEDMNTIKLLSDVGINFSEPDFGYLPASFEFLLRLLDSYAIADGWEAETLITNCSQSCLDYVDNPYFYFQFAPVLYFAQMKNINLTSPRDQILEYVNQSTFDDRFWYFLVFSTHFHYPCQVATFYRVLWPANGILRKDDIRDFEHSHTSFMIAVAFLIGSIRKSTGKLGFMQFSEVIQEILLVNKNLHYFHRLRDQHICDICGCTLGIEGTPLIFYLIGSIQELTDRMHGQLRLRRLHVALLNWLCLLQKCGMDLLEYGKVERRTLMSYYFFSSQRLARTPQYMDEMSLSPLPKLRDIRYGAKPEDWSLVLDMEVEEFAGEFWETVETPRFPMPGAWVDD